MGKNFKGQAAMEYLMTYGWAILVLVIVIAALYFFLPRPQNSCLFQQGFACEGSAAQIFVDTDGDLFVSARMSNKLGQNVENMQVLCTNTGTGNIGGELFSDAGASATDNKVFKVGTDDSLTEVAPGASFDVKNVPCVDAEADQVKSSEGSGFKGFLAIRYNLDTDVDSNVKHTAIGTVSGTVSG